MVPFVLPSQNDKVQVDATDRFAELSGGVSQSYCCPPRGNVLKIFMSLGVEGHNTTGYC